MASRTRSASSARSKQSVREEAHERPDYLINWNAGPLGLVFRPALGLDMPPVVAHVLPENSAASVAGVRAGDMLVSVNGKKTSQQMYAKVVRSLFQERLPVILHFRAPFEDDVFASLSNDYRHKLRRKQSGKDKKKKKKKTKKEPKLSESDQRKLNKQYTAVWDDGSLGISFRSYSDKMNVPCVEFIAKQRGSGRNMDKICVNDVLIAINGEKTKQLGVERVLRWLLVIDKPVVLRFHASSNRMENASQTRAPSFTAFARPRASSKLTSTDLAHEDKQLAVQGSARPRFDSSASGRLPYVWEVDSTSNSLNRSTEGKLSESHGTAHLTSADFTRSTSDDVMSRHQTYSFSSSTRESSITSNGSVRPDMTLEEAREVVAYTQGRPVEECEFAGKNVMSMEPGSNEARMLIVFARTCVAKSMQERSQSTSSKRSNYLAYSFQSDKGSRASAKSQDLENDHRASGKSQDVEKDVRVDGKSDGLVQVEDKMIELEPDKVDLDEGSGSFYPLDDYMSSIGGLTTDAETLDDASVRESEQEADNAASNYLYLDEQEESKERDSVERKEPSEAERQSLVHVEEEEDRLSSSDEEEESSLDHPIVQSAYGNVFDIHDVIRDKPVGVLLLKKNMMDEIQEILASLEMEAQFERHSHIGMGNLPEVPEGNTSKFQRATLMEEDYACAQCGKRTQELADVTEGGKKRLFCQECWEHLFFDEDQDHNGDGLAVRSEVDEESDDEIDGTFRYNFRDSMSRRSDLSGSWSNQSMMSISDRPSSLRDSSFLRDSLFTDEYAGAGDNEDEVCL